MAQLGYSEHMSGDTSVLNGYDRQLEELRSRNPGWKIWYVPLATGGANWCAQPEPHLSENSADGLQAAINQTAIPA
jgi:hypothetical protein